MNTFLKTLTGIWLGALCFGCTPQMPDTYAESPQAPEIYPDYNGVTVPPNIAPLCFMIDEEADTYAARITYPGGEWTTDDRKVTPPEKKWHEILAASQGKEMEMEVFVEHDGKWTRRQPFHIHVNVRISRSPIHIGRKGKKKGRRMGANRLRMMHM